MSEHEKYEQVGRLAEEYSTLKGHLAHVQERLNKAQGAYGTAARVFQTIRVEGEKLIVASAPPQNIDGLLNNHELLEALKERDRLNGEIKAVADRLRPLAPHLLG